MMMTSPTGLFLGKLLLLSAAPSALASAAGSAGASGRRQSVSPTPRIHNSDLAQEGEVPWQVSLRDNADAHVCGGALLERDWVITSASCCDALPAPTKVSAGSLDINSLPQTLEISRVEIHPNYNPSTNVSDICLLQLKGPMTLNIQTSTVARAILGDLFTGDSCVVSGWGAEQEDGALATKLKKANVVKYSEVLCEELLPTTFKKESGMFCALGARNGLPAGPCTGDEGGALVCFNHFEGIPTLGGIVSSVTDCAAALDPVSDTLPGIHTAVSEYSLWISGLVSPYSDAQNGAKKAAPFLGLLVLALAHFLTDSI